MFPRLPPEVWSLILKHIKDTSKINYYDPFGHAFLSTRGYKIIKSYLGIAWLFTCTGSYIMGKEKPLMRHFWCDNPKQKDNNCLKKVYICIDNQVADSC